MMKKVLAPLMFALMCTAAPARAEPAGGAAFTQCAGYYLALLQWAGKDRLGEDAWATYLAGWRRNMEATALLKLAEGERSPDVAVALAKVGSKEAAAGILARLKANAERSGQRLTADPELLRIGIRCPSVTREANDVIARIVRAAKRES